MKVYLTHVSLSFSFSACNTILRVGICISKQNFRSVLPSGSRTVRTLHRRISSVTISYSTEPRFE